MILLVVFLLGPFHGSHMNRQLCLLLFGIRGLALFISYLMLDSALPFALACLSPPGL